MKRIPIPSIVMALVIVLILVVKMLSYQVRFSEVAVKVSLWNSQNVTIVDKPGLYMRWPVPIEKVKTYDTRLRVLDTPETEVKTKDKQQIIVGCYAVWRIKDPLQFYVRVPVESAARAALRDRINVIRAFVIGRHNMSEFTNLDRSIVDRAYDRIAEEMLAAAKDEVLADYGIELVQIGIRRISLPQEATQKVLDAMKQERLSQAEKFAAEGRSLKVAIEARAMSASMQILSFAELKAQEIANAGVQASVSSLRKIRPEDEEFFLWLQWLEALENALKERSTIFLDSNSELFRRFDQPMVIAPVESTP